MEQRKTLLERFGIPINHLDFAYVKKCQDAREMEKIVQILRSGEEGYYPDLTQCAEQRLHELKPQSRLFRYEEPLRSYDCMSANEWQPIYDWTNEIKSQDHQLAELKQNDQKNVNTNTDNDNDLPPIRKGGRIAQTATDQTVATLANTTTTTTPTERIKSTDYNKWDKYDADEELLRMDLAEERISEEVERKNRLNRQKCNMLMENKVKPQIKSVCANTLQRLTDVERIKLAEEYRLRGNDYFRAKEYEGAIDEYNRAIDMKPTAAAYNNRAIANIKLQRYVKAIDDCERCLQLEPLNLKARLRLAEANYAYGRRREAYTLYQKVLELEPSNAVALKAANDLRLQIGELPPAHATRLQIQEHSSKSTKSTEQNIPKKTKAPPIADYDLAALVKPNRIVKNKLATAAEALSGLAPKPLKNGPAEPKRKQEEHTPPSIQLTPNNFAAEEENHPTATLQFTPLNPAVERAKRSGRLLIEEL